MWAYEGLEPIIESDADHLGRELYGLWLTVQLTHHRHILIAPNKANVAFVFVFAFHMRRMGACGFTNPSAARRVEEGLVEGVVEREVR